MTTQIAKKNPKPNRSGSRLELMRPILSSAKYPTHEEEIALAKRAQKGDKVAMDRLLRGCSRLLAKMVAKSHPSNAEDAEDIFQEGMIGLMRAVEQFNWRLGYRFTTYATWWMRAFVWRTARRRRAVLDGESFVLDQPIARHDGKDADTADRVSHLPSEGPTAEEMLIRREEHRRVTEAIDFVVGLANPSAQAVRRAAIMRHASDDTTLDSVGQNFGVSRERVRQIEQVAMYDLRCVLRHGKNRLDVPKPEKLPPNLAPRKHKKRGRRAGHSSVMVELLKRRLSTSG